MSFTRRNKTLIFAGITAAVALLVSGCSASAPSTDSNAPVTLKLNTFGNFGYTDKMLAKYKQLHPNITVVQNVAATESDARTAMFTKLAAGSGLADVEGIEVGWIADLKQYADKFVPVTGDKNGDWVKAQTVPATTTDGKLFAYGVATGPEAICYRADLLEKAGLPGDPESVTKLIGTTWKDYFAAGDKYTAGGGKGWFDSAYSMYSAQVEQLAYPYEKKNGTIEADNPAVKKIFRDTMAVAPKLSAKLSPFSDDWSAAMGNGGFATMACPSWMLGVIQGNSKGVTTWNVANAFPGGGGSVGGSFLAVPTQSKHPKEAAALASWLTAPEQQIAAFKTAGGFPSRDKALDAKDLTSYVDPFFNSAPVGQIFSDRSKAIKVVPYKGPKFIAIDTSAFNAIGRVEAGTQSVDDAWKQFVTEANSNSK